HEVVDRAFDRIYRAKVGHGFTMPERSDSFRAYLYQVLRGEAATAWGRRRGPNRDGFPASVEAAAERLGVSENTVRRIMKRLARPEWTEAPWEAVRERARTKRSWQAVQRRLEGSGRKPEAARKQVQRWRRQGRSPDAVLSSLAAGGVRVPDCSSCGDP